ncbi:hypothetical protein NMY22_g11463 [Coprinellus aureogranulatus]|nr:hypothetical protein NMY22_g11463 [Coprinellus aureogranulatus]
MVTFHIPWTKTTRELGATLTFVHSPRCSPVSALRNHLGLSSQAPRDSHLFSFSNASGTWFPLTKSRFLARCEGIWTRMHLLKVDGHSFRIGGATELLVGGVPPHVVAMIGRWKSLAFLSYWRQVSEVILKSFSSSYDTSRFSSILKSIELLHSSSK